MGGFDTSVIGDTALLTGIESVGIGSRVWGGLAGVVIVLIGVTVVIDKDVLVVVSYLGADW